MFKLTHLLCNNHYKLRIGGLWMGQCQIRNFRTYGVILGGVDGFLIKGNLQPPKIVMHTYICNLHI